jgi:hypothetical protein
MAYYFGKRESLCGIGVKSLCPHAFLLYRRLVSLIASTVSYFWKKTPMRALELNFLKETNLQMRAI